MKFSVQGLESLVFRVEDFTIHYSPRPNGVQPGRHSPFTILSKLSDSSLLLENSRIRKRELTRQYNSFPHGPKPEQNLSKT